MQMHLLIQFCNRQVYYIRLAFFTFQGHNVSILNLSSSINPSANTMYFLDIFYTYTIHNHLRSPRRAVQPLVDRTM